MKQVLIQDKSDTGLGILAEAYLHVYAGDDLQVGRIPRKRHAAYREQMEALLNEDNLPIPESKSAKNMKRPDHVIFIGDREKQGWIQKGADYYYLTYPKEKYKIQQKPIALLEKVKKDILIFIGKELR